MTLIEAEAVEAEDMHRVQDGKRVPAPPMTVQTADGTKTRTG